MIWSEQITDKIHGIRFSKMSFYQIDSYPSRVLQYRYKKF